MTSAYIALEGLDGSGKTTQTQRLASRLIAQGAQVITVREPSDSPIGQLIRRGLAGALAIEEASLALLFAADRLHQQQTVILPRRAAGTWVISDRSLLSSLAYQSLSDQLDLAWLRAINRPVQPPDLTIFLALDPVIAVQRGRQRAAPHERYDDLSQQCRIAQHFAQAIQLLRAEGQRIVAIDAAGDPDHVAEAIWQEVIRLGWRPA